MVATFFALSQLSHHFLIVILGRYFGCLWFLFFFVTLGWTYAGSEEEMRVVQQGRKNTRNFPRKSTAEVAGMGSLQTDVKKLQKITSRKRKNVSVHEESEDNM